MTTKIYEIIYHNDYVYWVIEEKVSDIGLNKDFYVFGMNMGLSLFHPRTWNMPQATWKRVVLTSNPNIPSNFTALPYENATKEPYSEEQLKQAVRAAVYYAHNWSSAADKIIEKLFERHIQFKATQIADWRVAGLPTKVEVETEFVPASYEPAGCDFPDRIEQPKIPLNIIKYTL